MQLTKFPFSLVLWLGIMLLVSPRAEATSNFRVNQDRRTKESTLLFTDLTVKLNEDEPLVTDANNNPVDPETRYANELKLAKSRAEDIRQVVMQDLSNSNLFNLVNNDSKMKRKLAKNANLLKVDIDKIPEYSIFAEEGIDAILVMEMLVNIDGSMRISARLWDIMDEKQAYGQYYTPNDANWRRVAHLIADGIYKGLTGEEYGYFDSKLTFVVESGSVTQRIKKLAEMDFDGENFRILTSGDKLVLTPVYSGDKKSIYYLEYSSRVQPPIMKQLQLADGSIAPLGSFIGMAYSPARHPLKNNTIAIAIADNGISNIYEVDLSKMNITKITDHRSINTTPFYSPDGSKIVFSSDRGGPQKLYVYDFNTQDTARISKGEGNYAKPSWSPDGRLIAFTKNQRGRFSIGLMTPDGKNEREIANGYMVEGVKWSPNGRYVIYSKQTKAYGKESIPKLFISDVLTGYEYQIPLPEGVAATDPDWVMKTTKKY